LSQTVAIFSSFRGGLGGGGGWELIFCAIRTAQAQAVQLEDVLEVGEQHLDLLPLVLPRHPRDAIAVPGWPSPDRVLRDA